MAEQLPDDVRDAFVELGSLQRGRPENAMLKVQFANGGGVLQPIVEHVGDLTHRMTHLLQYSPDNDGREMVLSKCEKALGILTNSYGFLREHMDNQRANAECADVSVGDLRDKVDNCLRAYADEHAALPVYNRAQWLARESAVAVGRQDWREAVSKLMDLRDLARDPEAFREAALDYTRSPDGALQTFGPSGNPEEELDVVSAPTP